MKILFDHPNPFVLTHGGFQTQIEQTKAALSSIGVDVEYLRWWDGDQRGDVIHYFGRPPLAYFQLARGKGIKVVVAELMTAVGSRGPLTLLLEKAAISICRTTLPSALTWRFSWDCFRLADACVALTAWEAHVMSYLFGARPERVHVVPNGVEELFFQSSAVPRGPWLVCTATITERKRIVELAQAALQAQTPLWVVGKPYSESDPYGKRFYQLAKANPQFIRYEGAIGDRSKLAQVYRQARGFVLLSTMESLSLSALEAAACECPLLLGDLPWARTVFQQSATYCPIASPTATARVLRRFYDDAPQLQPPPKPLLWTGVARQLKTVYESLCQAS